MPARARQDYRLRVTPRRRARKRRACAKRPLDGLELPLRCVGAADLGQVLRKCSKTHMRLSAGRLATA